jgi:hypothetical protein
LVFFAVLAAAMLFVAGCSAPFKQVAGGDSSKKTMPGKVEMPSEIGVTLSLDKGAKWKDRFVSTGEIKRTLRTADGKESSKSRSLGLELTAVQTVREVKGDVATIEIHETSAKILQEGKFVDVPFRRLSPPDTVTFTLDMKTGKADFSGMEKAYTDWFTGVKSGPAGEIVGKAFRMDAYVAQLRDLYAKPFTRLSGKKLTKEYRTQEEKEFLLPFLGPGASLGPMPVETSMAYEGFEVKGGHHYLNAAGKYSGESTLTPDQLSERLDEFDVKVPTTYTSKSSATGRFKSSVDVLSGRELQAESQVTYSATASFGGSAFTEEIAAKFLLIPEE